MWTVSANDFETMRGIYIDILRLRNYNDQWYYALLAEFDQAVQNNDTEKITAIMKGIGITLI